MFITRALDNKSPVIFGDGEQSRDFTYVSNVVNANLLAAQTDEVSGEIINIAGGKRIPVNTLVGMIIQKMGKDLKPMHDDPRPGEVLHSVADISKAEQMLNYRTTMPFEEGLEKTIEWFKSAS
jgi:UDP-glucose 4-epimerase